MNKMRLKINVCCYCEAWGSGGIESLWVNLVKQIDLSLYKIDIVVAKKLSGFYDAQLKALGIRLIVLSGSTRKYRSNYVLLKKLFQCRRYDVVHINAYQAMTQVYTLCAKRSGIKTVVVHSHCSGIKNGKGRLVKFAAHTLAKHFFADDSIIRIACSKPAQKFMYPRRKNAHIVLNGIDLNEFRYSDTQREHIRCQLGINHAFVVGMIGRLCREKNQAFGMEVFAELRKYQADAVLLIIGEGEAKEHLCHLVKKRGLQNHVIFLGVSLHVQELLQGMDVLLMPSRIEGFGITAIEAQVGGLPVVCSDQVPEEVMLDKNLMIRIPLYKSKRRWVEALVKSYRQEVCGFENTDYDICTTANAIEEIWIKGI